ncbi:MAG: pilus assembly protein [Methylocystis sp.]|nr:pilus assembly protein [Methylocystis sp.]MCA3590583.1 pilus assembly protein [Methylocystis sp.]
MITLFKLLRRIANDRQGSIIVPAALMLPVLIVGLGAAIDISRLQSLRTTAQSAADSAALATVRESALAGMTTQKLTDTARSFARSALGEAGAVAEIGATASSADGTVTVSINLPGQTGFWGMVGMGGLNIAVSATARLVGKMKICLLALETGSWKTLEASKGAKITGAECSFFVNSAAKTALSVKDTAKFTAQAICSSGGFVGTSANFAPMPKIDCPAIPDPLVNRPPPAAGGCDYRDKEFKQAGIVTLRPGVYCGGLKIKNSAIARLDPGIYVIRDGKLLVDDTATLQGKDVGFYLQGSDAKIRFDRGTTIDLSAPTGGQMAGLLFYEDRNVSDIEKHRIYSNNAHTLLGTIYLPKGHLFIESNKPIAQKAAFTIIVAGQIEMTGGPELFLNANYGSTTVPVPAGLGPVSGNPQLIR